MLAPVRARRFLAALAAGRLAPRAFDFDASQLPLREPIRRTEVGRRAPTRFVRNREQKDQDPLKHEILRQSSMIERSRRLAAELRTSPEPLTVSAYFAQDGVSKNVYHYTRLIRLQHAHGRIQDCVDTFQAMKLDGRIPNARTYSAILSALCVPTHWAITMATGDRQAQGPWYDVACRIFDEAMQLPAAARSSFVHAAMLKVCAAAGESARARDLLARMDQHDVAVSSVALERAVRASTRNQQLAQAWDTFLAYRPLVGIPSLHLYTRMVQVAGRLRRTADAVLLFEELLEVGYRPTVVQYNAILHAAVLSPPNRHYASSLFEQMLKDGGCRPDVRTLTLVMVASAKTGDVDLALQVMPLLASMEIAVDTLHDLFCQFMTCVAISNRDSPDDVLLQKSSADGRAVSVVDRCRLAEEAFQLMQTKYDLPITNRILNALLFVYVFAEKMPAARSVLESFVVHGLRPDLESYKALLSPFVKAILAPDYGELDRLRQLEAWRPDLDLQADLRRWAAKVAPRSVGVEALEFVLRPPLPSSS